MGLFAIVISLAYACDKFPENAAVSVQGGVPMVVFRACSQNEALREIVVLEWDGQGQGDDSYEQVWEATIRQGYEQENLWPLSSDDQRYKRVSGSADMLARSETGFRVIVYTSERRIVTSFSPETLAEGEVRFLGKKMTIDEYLRSNKIC